MVGKNDNCGFKAFGCSFTGNALPGSEKSGVGVKEKDPKIDKNKIERKKIILLVCTTIGAFYFGINQQCINSQLAEIAQYNHKQALHNEKVNILTAKKELQTITSEIWDLHTGYISNISFKKQSRKERFEIKRRVQQLLYKGLDNYYLVNNEQELSKWLQAMTLIRIYKRYSYDDIVIAQKPGQEFDITDDVFDKDMVIHLEEAFTLISEVQWSLGVSISRMSIDLSMKLKQESEKDSIKIVSD